MDYCIASIHTILYKSPDPAENLRAYQGAMEDARVKIIGHPEDGRAPVDFFALARAARDAGVLIEVNNSSLRPISYRQNTRENMTALLRACEDCGALRLPGHGRPLRPRRGPLRGIAFPA